MASPSATMPSKGTMLPTWTVTKSPSRIRDRGTNTSAPSIFCQTLPMFRDMLLARSSTDFFLVHSSRSPPIPKRNMIEPAVFTSLRAMDTVMAVASRTSTSSLPFARHRIPFQRYGTAWTAVYRAFRGLGKNVLVNAFTSTLRISFSLYSRFSARPVCFGASSISFSSA